MKHHNLVGFSALRRGFSANVESRSFQVKMVYFGLCSLLMAYIIQLCAEGEHAVVAHSSDLTAELCPNRFCGKSYHHGPREVCVLALATVLLDALSTIEQRKEIYVPSDLVIMAHHTL